ncbi:MAG: SAM-dependent methyltransferase [Actinomycetia bacterium]|nr:SAM-dependent methyltransferase [Actinomycetes bacterium]
MSERTGHHRSAGRPLHVWNEVESVAGDLVTFTGTTAQPDGTVLSCARTTLRFLGPQALGPFLDAAGFQVEAQYGDWDRAPVTTASREIITIARTAGLRSSPQLSRRRIAPVPSGEL